MKGDIIKEITLKSKYNSLKCKEANEQKTNLALGKNHTYRMLKKETKKRGLNIKENLFPNLRQVFPLVLK